MKTWRVAAIACGLAFAADPSTERSRFYVTPAASALVEQGLALAAPNRTPGDFQDAPAPGVRFQPNQAQATPSPWVDSNLWRFQRGLKKANYAKLPAGSAPLAAAEAFAFHIDAILNPDPADVPELGKLLAFLKAQDQPALPVMANIGIVDDHSPAMGEVLNMLTRRNLLYRVVPAPDRGLDLTIQLGAPDFPKESARNPADFAARVREKLGDEKRLVRLYGTNTTIANLAANAKRARLVLLSYSRNRTQPGVRVRVLGRYQSPKLAAYGTTEGALLTDIDDSGNAMEFSVPQFSTIAIIDLAVK
uniref:Uncharacterized protein n=1 Tax=Solibacter usitatus (strain Ellin6076) TaxID=234267 RepID=Q01TE2_SOLUE